MEHAYHRIPCVDKNRLRGERNEITNQYERRFGLMGLKIKNADPIIGHMHAPYYKGIFKQVRISKRRCFNEGQVERKSATNQAVSLDSFVAEWPSTQL